jgi:hypothetical protein
MLHISILKTDAVCFSKILVSTLKATQCHTPEDHSQDSPLHKTIKTYNINIMKWIW